MDHRARALRAVAPSAVTAETASLTHAAITAKIGEGVLNLSKRDEVEAGESAGFLS